MSRFRTIALTVLLILNVPVWLGQVWPEGAPPFARAVNVVFLTGTLLFFAAELWRGRATKSS
jgi:hypothetical protein